MIRLYVAGPDQHEKTVEVVECGQTFAEAAMFSGQGYPVSAAAVEDSELVQIDAYSLMRYLREHPELNWQMLAVLSRRLHQMVGQIRSVTLHNAEQKVATFLLEHWDPEEPAEPVGHLPSRRAALASMLGLTTETLCRVVSSFRRRGWIATTDHGIYLQDREALNALLQRPRR
jgi:CRP-like cAMP-binding protein